MIWLALFCLAPALLFWFALRHENIVLLFISWSALMIAVGASGHAILATIF